jgi:hypothetical protein
MQIADAVRFVEQNQAELARLVAFPGVESVSLDFGIEERDMAAQSERFPPNLLRVVGNLGIWLEFTLYPCPLLSPVKSRHPTNGFVPISLLPLMR